MDELKVGYYVHSKSKKLYEVIGVARDSENPDEEIIVYKALYNHPKFGMNSLWVRPKKMFLEEVVIEGEKVPRFKFAGEKPK